MSCLLHAHVQHKPESAVPNLLTPESIHDPVGCSLRTSPRLTCLRCVHQVPIPQHMDLYHLQEEAEPSDRTALESVVDYIKHEIEVRQHVDVLAVPHQMLAKGAASRARTGKGTPTGLCGVPV